MDGIRKKNWLKTEEVTSFVLLTVGILAVSGLTFFAVQLMLAVGPKSFVFYVTLTGMVVVWTKIVSRLAKDA